MKLDVFRLKYAPYTLGSNTFRSSETQIGKGAKKLNYSRFALNLVTFSCLHGGLGVLRTLLRFSTEQISKLQIQSS